MKTEKRIAGALPQKKTRFTCLWEKLHPIKTVTLLLAQFRFACCSKFHGLSQGCSEP